MLVEACLPSEQSSEKIMKGRKTLEMSHLNIWKT